MKIDTYIADKKSLVSSFLSEYLKQHILPEVSPMGKWGNDAVTRILNLTLQGKMLRSALLYASYNLFVKDLNNDALQKAAAALELIQTGLIIHDDVMDQDEKRRGFDSMHTQYQKILASEGMKNPKKTSESFAICVGDMAYFLAFRIIGLIEPKNLSSALTQLFARENSLVCVGQMMDVFAGNTKKLLSEKEILSIYENKTARYSCLLPLVAGATIAGADAQTIRHLTKLGLAMGILFQVQDDTLNLFGNPKITGKPVGSDIREGKQTLHYLLLREKANLKDQEKITHFFGNPSLTENEIQEVLHLMTTYHIPEFIDTKKKVYNQLVIDEMTHLKASDEGKKQLMDLVQYSMDRNK